MDENIKELMLQLNWNNTEEIQELAIKSLAQLDDLDLTILLQPALPYGKDYWENSAKVLFIIGYPKIKNIIPGLFEWLQDMNWPGALIVKELLLHLPIDVLKYNYECTVNYAISTNDEEWLLNLTLFWNDVTNKVV